MSAHYDQLQEQEAQKYCSCPFEVQELDGDAVDGYYCLHCDRPVDSPDPMDYDYTDYSQFDQNDGYEFYQEQ